MIYFMSFIMSVLNRLRGSGILSNWPSRISKFIAPLFIFILCTDVGSISMFLYILIAYLLGESLGWGKWVATLCDKQPRYNEQEGHTYFYFFGFLINFWDGIHHIANFIIKEEKDFMNYSRIALAIRGIYWWLPVLLVMLFYGQLNWFDIIWSSIALGISFPISFDIGRNINIKTKLLEGNWEKGELIHGFFQGLVFTILTIF